MSETIQKQSYKQTEVGLIPEDWEIVEIKNNITVARGGSPRPIQNYLTKHPNGINWIKIGDTSSKSKYIISSVEKIIPDGINNSREVKVGDFLLSNSMSFGRPYILKIKGCIHDGWLVLQNYQASFDTEYLYYELTSKHVFDQYIQKASGSSVLNLNKEIVNNVLLVKPPLTEQRAIATALSDVDELLRSLEQLISKKQAIKHGAMQELLTPPNQGGKRLPGFSGKWEEKSFNEIFFKKNSKKHQIQSKEYNAFGKIPVVDQGKKRIVAYSDNDTKKFLADPKTPIIVFGDHTRELKFIDFPFVIGADGTQLLDVYNEFDIRFMFELLFEYEIPNTGYNRHFKFLKELKFLFPKNKNEQKAIAQVLSDMDDEIKALEEKKVKYQKIKEGMMQELLTGKIRLV